MLWTVQLNNSFKYNDNIIISILTEIKYNHLSTTLSNTTFKNHNIFLNRGPIWVFKEINILRNIQKKQKAHYVSAKLIHVCVCKNPKNTSGASMTKNIRCRWPGATLCQPGKLLCLMLVLQTLWFLFTLILFNFF